MESRATILDVKLYQKLYEYAKSGHSKLLYISLNKLSHDRQISALAYSSPENVLSLKNPASLCKRGYIELSELNSSLNYKYILHSNRLEAYINLLYNIELNVLSVAVVNGHYNVINMLITKFGNTLKPYNKRNDGLGDNYPIQQSDNTSQNTALQYIFKGSLSLWLATALGNIKIVKALLEFGVKPDCKPSITDITLNNVDKICQNPFYSCLMIACYKTHESIVEELLIKGAKVCKWDVYGYTPFHYAAEKGNLKILKLLIASLNNIHYCNCNEILCNLVHSSNLKDNNLKHLMLKWQNIIGRDYKSNPNIKSESPLYQEKFDCHTCLNSSKIEENMLHRLMRPTIYGSTPLRLTAESLNDDCVNYLIKDLSCANLTKTSNVRRYNTTTYPFSSQEIIEAYELLAAGYMHDHLKQDLVKAKYYFQRAIKERVKYEKSVEVLASPDIHVKTPNSNDHDSPHPLFAKRVPSVTLSDYDAIINNLDELYIETLMILERIYGPYHFNYSMKLKNLGAKYAKNAEFYKCLPFWIYSLEIDYVSGQCVNETLLKMIRIFSQMLTLDIDFQFENFFVLLVYSEKSLVRNLTLNRSNHLDHESAFKIQSQIEATLLVILYTVQLFTVIETNVSSHNATLFKQKLYDILKLDARALRGQTLLHLATDADTKVDEFFHMDELCKNPDPDTVDLLIQCGADVDATDHLGNTALHLAVVDLWSYNFPSSLRIVLALVKADAHLDYFNHDGFSLLEDHEYPYQTSPEPNVINNRPRDLSADLSREESASGTEVNDFTTDESESYPEDDADFEEVTQLQIDDYLRDVHREMRDLICEEANYTQFPPLFTQVEVTLKCLAARTVRKLAFPYTSNPMSIEQGAFLVPETLRIFLDRHGPKLKPTTKS